MTFKRRFDGGGIWKSSIIYVNSGLRYLCFPRSKWAYEKMKMVVMKRRGAVLRLSVRNVVVETGGTGFWCAYSVIQGMISHVLICRDSTLWCFLNSATHVLHVSQLVLICTELHFFSFQLSYALLETNFKHETWRWLGLSRVCSDSSCYR